MSAATQSHRPAAPNGAAPSPAAPDRAPARIAAPARRALYGALTLALLAAVVVGFARDWGPWWQVAVFSLAPDLALVAGIGALAEGQLHPRAVPAYNLVHRFWGPVLLAPLAPLGALAWALHVSLDRTVGYGLRTPDGFQRA